MTRPCKQLPVNYMHPWFFDTFQPIALARHVPRRLDNGYISQHEKPMPSSCLQKSAETSSALRFLYTFTFLSTFSQHDGAKSTDMPSLRCRDEAICRAHLHRSQDQRLQERKGQLLHCHSTVSLKNLLLYF